MSEIIVKTYFKPPIKTNEILRYSGGNPDNEQFGKILNECLNEVENKFTYKVCYSLLPISFLSDYIDLSFTKTSSLDLRKNLINCDKVIVFAATIGFEIDRLIIKYSRISPIKSLIFQSIGAERIESLCDAFCADLIKEYKMNSEKLKPRFSPGYGDLPLEIQSDIFKYLDCYKKIGLSLNESLLMAPSKSVTAFIGVYK